MTETKFTPGPWSVEPHGNALALYSGRSHEPMNGRHGLNLMRLGDGDRNMDANVALIAAAPDLYATLERIASRFDWVEQAGSIEWLTRQEALRALAKARGETP